MDGREQRGGQGCQKNGSTYLVRVPTCEVDGDGAAEGETVQDDASVFETIVIEDEVERCLGVYSKACG